MARPPRFPEENRPYFVTTAIRERKSIFADELNASAMRDALYETRAKYGFLILGYVIMPDHLHAVLVPRPINTISQVMRYIKGRYARLHNVRYSSSGSIWQASFYDRAVRDEKALRDILTYIHDNPVRSGLKEVAEDYVFSSAREGCQTDLDRYLGGQAECLTYEQ